MRKHAALSASTILLCALALAGCAGASPMSAPPKKVVPPTTTPATPATCSELAEANLISACGRLGELSTFDPCSLITVGQLPPDLAASPADRNSLDFCSFNITAGADKHATVEVGQLSKADSDYDAGTQDLKPTGLELEKGTLANGECDDAVQFGGDLVYLEINAFVLDGDGSQALCDAANEVGDAVGTVIAGKTQVQHFTVPANSIATLQACGLANGAQVDANTLDDQPDSPSGHSCRWVPDSSDLNLQVGLTLEIGSDIDAQAADAHTKIDGLESYTLKDSEAGYSRCEVDTNRIPWGGASGGLLEIASAWAEADAGQVDKACSLATQLAGVVWPKLPPLS